MASLQQKESPGNFETSHPAACWGSKVGAVFLLACVGVFGAWIPLALRRCRLEKFIAVLNTFAGGAFLGLALFHIMPEASQHVEQAKLVLHVGGGGAFNTAYLFFFVGYVAILICEKVLTIDDAESGGGSESQGTATRVREDPELSICSSCLPPALQDPCCSVLDTSGLLQNDGRSWGVVLQRPQSLLGAGSPVGNGSPSLTGEQQQLGSPCGSPRSLTPVGRSICQEGERGSGGNAMASLANTAHGELRVPAEFKSEEESYQRSAAYPGGVQGNMPRVSLSVRGARRQEKGAQELKGVVVSSLQEFSQLGEEGLDRYRKPTSVAESAGLCAYAQDRVPAVLASAGTQEDCVRVFDTRGPAASEHDQRTRSPREGGGEEDSDGEKLFEEGRRPAQKTNECILRLSGLRDGLGNYGKMKLPADDEARLAHAVAVDFEGGRRRPGRRPLSGVDGGAVFLMIALAIHGLFEGMIIGAETNLVSVLVTTSVVAGHKWAESLMLMSEFMERGLAPQAYWLLMSVFVASSPIGVLVGVGISGGGEVASGVCNALGAGTLIYVATEISGHVFSGSRRRRLGHLIVYCLGVTTVLGLTFLDIALEPPSPRLGN